jgi:GAF domain-containing protein
LAKQFGVSDAALDGLKDPRSHPFPPDQKAALLFADAMTEGPGHVPDPVYEELRRHFSEAQIVEIACVIGLFNYFNRFNNALHVEVTRTDPDVLARWVAEVSEQAAAIPELCDRVAQILHTGRQFSRVAIYQRENDRLVLRSHRGPAPLQASLRPGEGDVGAVGERGGILETGSKLVVPIRAGAAIVGVIEAERTRPAALDEEDRPVVERVAALLAPRLT